MAIGLIGHIVFTASFVLQHSFSYKPLPEHREKDVDSSSNNPVDTISC
ncbi:hypothetical protein O9992_00815 [Vibrio lentus]|nr:hypothetical protein [Vibrio lentus]